MMTRSGCCHGAIPQTWHRQISGILEKIKEALGTLDLRKPFPVLECWDQLIRLGKLIELRREDEFWIIVLWEHLLALREKIARTNEEWVAGMVLKINNLIHEIRG
jgi:hypothetical protein